MLELGLSLASEHGGQPHWKIIKSLCRSCAEVKQIIFVNHKLMSAGQMKLKLKSLKYITVLWNKHLDIKYLKSNILQTFSIFFKMVKRDMD